MKTKTTLALAAALAVGLSYSHAAVSSTGLVGYYTFDSDTTDDTSSSIAGASASSNGGSYTGSAAYTGGMFGKSATVADGAGSNYLTVSGAEYNFGTGNFSVVLWVNLLTSTGGDPALVASGGRNWSNSGTAPAGYQMDYTNNDDLGATVSAGSGATRADVGHVDIDHNDWSLVALTVDRGGNATVYALDELVTTIGDDASAPTTTDVSGIAGSFTLNNDIVFGQDGDGAGYSLAATNIDDVSIWTRALSQAEIQEIYTEGRAGNALGAIAIPEPSSTALLGLGGLALILRRRK